MDNETPFHQPEPQTVLSYDKSNKVVGVPAHIIMSLVSLLNLAIAMLSVVYVAYQILVANNNAMRKHIFIVAFIIGLVYILGWVIALVGIRRYHNSLISFFIKIYSWMILLGMVRLYLFIIEKIYGQEYGRLEFFRYTLLMWIAIAGLVGFHLLLKNHNLQSFSYLLLTACLYHLYLIVYHYIFALDVGYARFFWDILFFFGVTIISVLMLLHVGLLSVPRSLISHFFDET